MRHKLRLLLLLALGGLGVAACSDDASMAPTPDVVAPSFRIARQCDVPGIRSALAQMLRGPAVAVAVPTFNRADAARRAGDMPAALEGYQQVLQLLIDEFVDGRVGTARFFTDAPDAVDYVLTSILACGGSTVSGIGSLVDGLAGARDRTICAVGPGAPNECTLPNSDVTVLMSPEFLDGLALVVIDRTPTVNPFVGYDRWSPIWHVQVLPITAQTNYPYYAGPGATWPAPPADPDAFAVIGVCVVDVAGEEHPPVDELRVAQAVELPTPGPVVELQPAAEVGGVSIEDRLDCTEGPDTSPVETAAAASRWRPFGSSRLAVAGWRALRGAGSMLGGLLSPPPLHAAVRFDGGIGGQTFALQSRFAAVEPDGGETPTLAIYEGEPNPSERPITSTTVAIGFTTELLARVRSAAAVMPATRCTWQSRNAAAATVTPAPEGASAVVRGIATGTATITANCLEGLASVTVTSSPPATVTAPPDGPR